MKVLHNIPAAAAAVLLSTFSFSGFAPVQAAAGAGAVVVTKDDSSDPEVDKIVNGYVLDGPLPYQVRLTNANGFLCGGSLISSRVVLTAAHCYINDDSSFKNPPKNVVEVNMYDINNPAGSGSITLSHAELGVDIFTHPGYNPEVSYENDVALVILPFGVLEGERIAYTKLNEDPEVPESQEIMFVSGWGYTSPEGPGSNILRATWVAYQQNLPPTTYPYCSTRSQMCGFLMINGTVSSPCEGDSGGPLMIASQDRDFPSPATDPLLQVGIVSAGQNCQGLLVYSRVSLFVPWIELTACEEVGELCSSTKGKGQRQGKANVNAKASKSKSKSSKALSISLI